MKVLGVDVLAGSVEAKAQPRYAVTLLENGSVVMREEITQRRLFRMIRELKPERVACDNVFELFSKDMLKRFFFLLPHKTMIVQVNGSPGNLEPLHVVAKRNGISLTSRASAMEEAEACAALAYRNVGCTVEAFEDRCKIIVSRARSIGRGGQSFERYRRRVHSLVQANVREIKGILDKLGLGYELSTVKADSGCSRGEFLVRAKREELRGIKRSRGPDVQIKILPVVREKLNFVPLGTEKKSVIAGIDPGTTSAVAVLDLEGNLCEVFSARSFSHSDAISSLTKYSEVAIVASDVSPAPKFVERVASSLSAVLFVPIHSLSVEEKIALVNENFPDACKNPHERDALSAALKAYKNYRNKLEQADKKLQELGLVSFREQVKKLVLGGVSLDAAIKRLAGEERKEAAETGAGERIKSSQADLEAGEHVKLQRLIKTLRDEIQVLRQEREELKKALSKRESRMAELEKRLEEARGEEFRKIRKEKEIQIVERDLQHLRAQLRNEKLLREHVQEELNELRRMRLLESYANLSVVKIIPRFTLEEVLRAKAKLEIKAGDVVYLRDASGGGASAAEELLKLNLRAIIADESKMSHQAREALGKAVLIPPSLNIKLVGSLGLVDSAQLEEAVKKEKTKKIATDENWLESVVYEYKKEREKELKG